MVICGRCGEKYDQKTGRHLSNDSNLCEDLE